MRTIDIIGVVEDGTPMEARSLGVPINPRTTITHRQGETLQIRYKVMTAGGGTIDLTADGAALTLTVRKVPGDTRAAPPFVATTPTGVAQPGMGIFTILPTDLPATRVLWGRYTYDVTLTRTSAGVDKTTPLSPFVIEPGDF